MQRRAFVYLSSVTAMALTLPALTGCGPSGHEKATAQPFVFSRLADVDTIVQTGLAYRKAIPQEDNQQKLTDLLLTGNHLNTSSAPEVICTALNNKVTEDFRLGRIVTIKGWVISVTEARQCALFSFLKL